MSAVDVKTLRDGDTVLVRGEIYGGRMIKFRCSEEGYAYHTISLDRGYDIASVEPRPLAVGDKVRVTGGGQVAEILAIDANEAWVKLYDASRATVSLSRLVRA